MARQDQLPNSENRAQNMKQASLQWLSNTKATVGERFRFIGDFATEISRPFTDRTSSRDQAVLLAFATVPTGIALVAGVFAFIAAPIPTVLTAAGLVTLRALSALHHADKHFEDREWTRKTKMERAARRHWDPTAQYKWSDRYSND